MVNDVSTDITLSQAFTSQKQPSSSQWPCLSLYSIFQRPSSTVFKSHQNTTSARERFREYFVFVMCMYV